MRPLAPIVVAALVIAGCGGGGTESKDPPKKPGPPIATVVDVARHNAGFAGCKRVEQGAGIPTPAATDPESIQPLLCDQLQVADYWVWNSDAEANAKAAREDRPAFVNGKVVVTTGDALLVKQFDAEKAKTLATEIRDACDCGTVVTP
jgi:hypothetical protein